MTLLVETPAGRAAERAYVLDVVLGDMLGLSFVTSQGAEPATRLRLAEDPDGSSIVVPDVFLSTPADHWLGEGSLPSRPLHRVRAPGDGAVEDERHLPVVFGACEATEVRFAAPTADGGLRLTVDVFGSAFFLLTRYEEHVLSDRDAHGRFPAAASLASREGFLDRPLVDEYARALLTVMRGCWPGLPAAANAFRLLLSHDVDHPFACLDASARTVARRAAGDVLRRRDPALLARRVAAAASTRRTGSRWDPHNTFGWMMDLSERHGLRSAFYLLTSPDGSQYPSPYGVGDPGIVLLLSWLAARGHEVGLHASYASMTAGGRVAEEAAVLRRLAALLGIRQERWGGRQHYLRWDARSSWSAWDAAGLDYDGSLGFAEAPGFRTGTCHEHQVFDVGSGRRLGLRERPLTVMLDATLFQYLELSPDAAAQAVLALARRCRDHRGDCSVLVHNDFLAERWARRWYRDVLGSLAGAGGGA